MPVLAIDLGGSKIAAALVERTAVLDRREVRTPRDAGAPAWIDAVVELTNGWTGYAAAGAAVTGLVREALWSAVNPGTLPVPDGFPLVDALTRRLGIPVVARNDAQAAAWGEYRFGGTHGSTVVFVTVSTGIGGGLVIDGRLVEGRAGLAGHLGITPVDTADGVRMLEDVASGAALSRLAEERGGAAAVTAAAWAGEGWATALLNRTIAPLALALRRLQLVLDPDVFVIGGGLGLAPGYLDCLERHLAPVPAPMRPTIRAAALGADAGLIGIADLAIPAAPEG